MQSSLIAGVTEIGLIENTFNDSSGILKPNQTPLLIGRNSQHFVLFIPQAPSLPIQSEKIFYGARIPISMQ